jgi:hypothetical protein
MEGTAEDEIDFDFDEVGNLVSTLLVQANRDDVADELDYPGRREAFAEEFIGLTVGLGGSVDVAASKITESDMPSAGYLVPRTRIHIRVKRASWQTALALVPLIASIVATGGILLPLLATTPLLAALKDTITPLTEDDRVLVVAVTILGKSLGRAVTAAEVQGRLGQADRRTVTDVQAALERLASAHVLERDGAGFSASF